MCQSHCPLYFLFATSQFPRPIYSREHCNVLCGNFQPHHNVGTWTGDIYSLYIPEKTVELHPLSQNLVTTQISSLDFVLRLSPRYRVLVRPRHSSSSPSSLTPPTPYCALAARTLCTWPALLTRSRPLSLAFRCRYRSNCERGRAQLAIASERRPRKRARSSESAGKCKSAGKEARHQARLENGRQEISECESLTKTR